MKKTIKVFMNIFGAFLLFLSALAVQTVYAGEISAKCANGSKWTSPVELQNTGDKTIKYELDVLDGKKPPILNVVFYQIFRDDHWETVKIAHDTHPIGAKITVQPNQFTKAFVSFRALRGRVVFPAIIRARLNLSGAEMFVYTSAVKITESGEIESVKVDPKE